MAYTYSDDADSDGNAPQKRDAVRFLIQDTKTAAGAAGGKLVTDAEIAFSIAEEANVYMAAARCCETLVMRANGVSSRRVGPVSISYNSDTFEKLAKSLRARGGNYQRLYAGALTDTDKAEQQDDTDATQPDFKRGEYEYPGLEQLDQERES